MARYETTICRPNWTALRAENDSLRARDAAAPDEVAPPARSGRWRPPVRALHRHRGDPRARLDRRGVGARPARRRGRVRRDTRAARGRSGRAGDDDGRDDGGDLRAGGLPAAHCERLRRHRRSRPAAAGRARRCSLLAGPRRERPGEPRDPDRDARRRVGCLRRGLGDRDACGASRADGRLPPRTAEGSSSRPTRASASSSAPSSTASSRTSSTAGSASRSSSRPIDRVVIIGKGDNLAAIRTGYALAATMGWWLPVITLALFGLGILIARRRSTAVLGTGLGFAIGGADAGGGLVDRLDGRRRSWPASWTCRPPPST